MIPEHKTNSPHCRLFLTPKQLRNPSLRCMHIAYELCLATAGKQIPSGPEWVHEAKYDGYRLLVIRENDCVGLVAKRAKMLARA